MENIEEGNLVVNMYTILYEYRKSKCGIYYDEAMNRNEKCVKDER